MQRAIRSGSNTAIGECIYARRQSRCCNRRRACSRRTAVKFSTPAGDQWSPLQCRRKTPANSRCAVIPLSPATAGALPEGEPTGRRGRRPLRCAVCRVVLLGRTVGDTPRALPMGAPVLQISQAGHIYLVGANCVRPFARRLSRAPRGYICRARRPRRAVIPLSPAAAGVLPEGEPTGRQNAVIPPRIVPPKIERRSQFSEHLFVS